MLELLVVTLALASTPAEWLPCTYWVDDPEVEQRTVERCASRLDEGRYQIATQRLADLPFGEHGLATLIVDGGFAYLRQDHDLARVVLTFDNGPDSFAGDRVRALRNGLVVYLDLGLEPAFAASYDWGEPFENGRALVCSGCIFAAPDGDGHRAVVGGRWGAIDRDGRVLLPLESERADAEAWLAANPPKP